MNKAARRATNVIDKQVVIDDDLAEVGTGVILSVATLVGVWGATCLASAIGQCGITAVASGWFNSLAG